MSTRKSKARNAVAQPIEELRAAAREQRDEAERRRNEERARSQNDAELRRRVKAALPLLAACRWPDAASAASIDSLRRSASSLAKKWKAVTDAIDGLVTAEDIEKVDLPEGPLLALTRALFLQMMRGEASVDDVAAEIEETAAEFPEGMGAQDVFFESLGSDVERLAPPLAYLDPPSFRRRRQKTTEARPLSRNENLVLKVLQDLPRDAAGHPGAISSPTACDLLSEKGHAIGDDEFRRIAKALKARGLIGHQRGVGYWAVSAPR